MKWLTNLFATLADQVRGTTPERIVARALDRIEAAEIEWGRIATTLEREGQWNPDGSPVQGDFAVEAVAALRARAHYRASMLEMVDEAQEGAAKDQGGPAGRAEAEARCRIADYLRLMGA